MIAALAIAAHAADWPLIQGTEAEGAALRPLGFVQVVGGAGDGWDLSVRRARVGVRGTVPGVDAVAVFAAVELGHNAITRVHPVVATDASLSLTAADVHLRAGRFKLPLGEEALESNPLAAEFVDVTETTGQLLQEQLAPDGGWVGASGYRDVAVAVFATRPLGAGAVSGAAALAQGQLGTGDDRDPDWVVRGTWSPWVSGRATDAHRSEVTFAGFAQVGRRQDDRRSRYGGAAWVETPRLRARVEGIGASGALEVSSDPADPEAGPRLVPDGRAAGGYGYVQWVSGPVAAGVRYDHLARELGPEVQRFRTTSVDLQLRLPDHRVRLLLDGGVLRVDALPGAPRLAAELQAAW